MGALRAMLEQRCGRELDLVTTVVMISQIPFGRPSQPTPEGVLREWRGTCSTKHLLLVEVVGEEWLELRPRLWHRPYVVTRELAQRRWGARVADVVPPEGLVDVHTWASLELGIRTARVDVTFPLASWDGVSDIDLACGEGADLPAGVDPLASKARIVAERCIAAVREPFIAALAEMDG